MNVERAVFRLYDVNEAIANVRSLLDGKTFEEMQSDKVVRAAFERYLEIVSEASRHVPEEWKTTFGVGVPWRNVAHIGNILRHAYRHIDYGILWSVYVKDLGPLKQAIDAMLAVHDPDGKLAPTAPPRPSP